MSDRNADSVDQVWIYIGNFAYSWGPVAWIVVSEVFPLSMRAKGVALGGSANWLNNFAGKSSNTPPCIIRRADFVDSRYLNQSFHQQELIRCLHLLRSHNDYWSYMGIFRGPRDQRQNLGRSMVDSACPPHTRHADH